MKIGILGAAGRMGSMLVRAVADTTGVELGAAIEQAGSAHRGTDAGTRAGIAPLGVAIDDDLDAALHKIDVLIDFTSPPATAATAMLAATRGVALVIGTTGCGEAELAVVRGAAARVPVVMSSNMSLGVNVLFGLLRQAAAALGEGFDAEIVELHHRLKKDSPSGTALSMAKELASVYNRDLGKVGRFGREGLVGARTHDEIGVLAVRGGDVVGEHTAYFLGQGERLELTHQATSRETFARGAVRAAQWVRGRPPRLYDMQDVLGLPR